MSASPEKDLKVYKHVEPTLQLDQTPHYVINVGGQDLTYSAYTTTNFSTSNITWTVNPSTGNTVVNRMMYMRVPFTITFNGTSVGPTLLQLGSNDAPRSFFLSKVLENIKLVLDNSSTSIQQSDLIMAWERYMKSDTKRRDLGMCAYMSDQYQNYEDYLVHGSAKNALGSYGEAGMGAEEPRGGYQNLRVISDDGTTAVVELEAIEPIFLSPMLWKHEYSDSKGLSLLNQIQVFAQLGKLERVWSHNAVNGENITGVNVVVGASSFDNPALLVNQIEGRMDEAIPKVLLYDYNDANIYKTEQSGAVAPGAPGLVRSQNIQVGQTPKRLYAYLMARQNDRTFETADAQAPITRISVNWNTRNSILADATPVQLYEISSKNGFQGSFNAWQKFSGSVLALDFGSDIPLAALDAPGRIGQGQLSLEVNFVNASNSDVTYELVICLVNEGVCVKTLNNTQFLSGIVTPGDVMSKNLPRIDGDLIALQQPYGGDLMSGLKKVVHGVKKFANDPRTKKAVEVGKHLGSLALKYGPEIAALLAAGYTEDEAQEIIRKEGMGLVGGKRISKAQLRSRLKKY